MPPFLDRRAAITGLRLSRGAALLILMVGLSALQSILVWRQATDSPWRELGPYHDSMMIGAAYDKTGNPQLFSRDYMYHDPNNFAFYTPSFLAIVRTIPILLRQPLDYPHVLALLQGPTSVLYLGGVVWLCWVLTRSTVIGLGVAVATTTGLTTLWDFWSVNGLYTMLPRTLALGFLVAATALLFWLLGDKESRNSSRVSALWVALGLLLGLLANIHPPTGEAFALIVGIFCLVHRRTGRTPSWRNLVILMVVTALASSPFLLHAVQTGLDRPVRDFAALMAFDSRYSQNLPLHKFQLADISDTNQWLLCVAWLLLTAGTWVFARPNRRSGALLLFGLVQLAAIGYIAVFFDTRILVFMAAGWFLAWWDRKDKMVFQVFQLAAITFLVSVWGFITLNTLGKALSSWPVVVLGDQLLRATRLLTLPLLMAGAVLIVSVLRRSRTRIELLIVAIAALSLGSPLFAVVLPGAALLLSLAEPCFRKPNPNRWLYLAGTVFVAAAGGVVFADALFFTATNNRLRLLFVLLALGIWFVLQPLRVDMLLRRALSLLTVGLAALAAYWVFRVDGERLLGLTLTPTMASVLIPVLAQALFLAVCLWLVWSWYKAHAVYPGGLAVASLGMVLLLQLVISAALTTVNTSASPLVSAAQWARENTSQDSLFFYGVTSEVIDMTQAEPPYPLDSSAAFRYWSQRSITHSTKDFNLVMITSPGDIPQAVQHYQELANSSLKPDTALAMAQSLDADYIVRNTGAPLNLPVAYRNADYVIYRLRQ